MSSFNTEANFSLPFKLKCGEVSFSCDTEIASLYCIFCSLSFIRFDSFILHIKKKHIKLNASTSAKIKAKTIIHSVDDKAVAEATGAQTSFNDAHNKAKVCEEKMLLQANQAENCDYFNPNVLLPIIINQEITADSKEKPAAEECLHLDASSIKTEVYEEAVLQEVTVATTDLASQQPVSSPYTPCLEDAANSTENAIKQEIHSDEDIEMTSISSNNRKESSSLCTKQADKVTFEIIEQLKKHEVIWNPHHTFFMSYLYRRRAYNAIIRAMAKTFPAEKIDLMYIKKRFRSLFELFRRSELGIMIPATDLVFCERLRFLRGHLDALMKDSSGTGRFLNISGHRKCKPVSQQYEHETHPCEMCGQQFAEEIVLRMHRKRLCKFRNKCTICGQVFRNIVRLKTHLMEHERSEKYACDMCGKKFAAETFLRNHRQRMCMFRNKCTICGQLFRKIKDLKKHLKSCKIMQTNSFYSVKLKT